MLFLLHINMIQSDPIHYLVKIVNIFLIVILSVAIFSSCQEKKGTKVDGEVSAEKIEVKDLKKAKIEISGMTCEIGCAKLIQSKLYKTDGVSFAWVSFEDSVGIVDFDANKISQKDLKKVVESAGGGDLYAVKEISVVEEIPNDDSSIGSK